MATEAGALRVVLLGKTGAGKSSTGNSLLGRQAFQVCRGLRSGTERCQWADADLGHLNLQVTDTPGLSDTHRPEEEVLKEVGKSIAVSSPGPHVILMVIRCDARFTREEYQAYITLKALFGDDVTKFMIIVFVGADAYGQTLEEQCVAVKDTMDRATGHLREVLKSCGDRYFGINNKACEPDRQRQADQLIVMMKALQASRGGQHFHNHLSTQVQSLLNPLVQQQQQQQRQQQQQQQQQAAGGGGGRMTEEEEAVRQVKRDIVEERQSPGVQKFFGSLLDVMENTVLPILQRGLSLALGVMEVAALAVECAVM